MSGKGGPPKLGGGMVYTRQIPNFLQKMQQQDDTGIEGAMKRAAAKPEREEREDNDEEAPVIVSDADASMGKKSKGQSSGGSLHFKGEDRSAVSKFRESAHERVRLQEAAAAAASASVSSGDADGGASASGGSQKIVFNSSAAQKKRKQPDATDKSGLVGAAKPKAKAVKNKSLLSFDEED